MGASVLGWGWGVNAAALLLLAMASIGGSDGIAVDPGAERTSRSRGPLRVRDGGEHRPLPRPASQAKRRRLARRGGQ